MSTNFVFCHTFTRRRSDPVEVQFTRLTVPKRGLAEIHVESLHTDTCLFVFKDKVVFLFNTRNQLAKGTNTHIHEPTHMDVKEPTHTTPL